VRGTVALRDGIPVGSVFLEEGLAEDSASALTDPMVEVRPA